MSFDVKSFKDVNKETLTAIVKAHLKSDGVEVTDVGPFEKLDAGGEGFCSDLKRVTVKYKVKGDGEEEVEKELHMAFKLPPVNFVKHFSKIFGMFVHEANWYTK